MDLNDATILRFTSYATFCMIILPRVQTTNHIDAELALALAIVIVKMQSTLAIYLYKSFRTHLAHLEWIWKSKLLILQNTQNTTK